MRKASLGILFICALYSADAAYKVQNAHDGHRDVREHGTQEAQPILDDFDIHTANEPEYLTDFRHGHGHTNQRGTSELECPTACTMEMAPVCGSDGRSYSNKCELMVTACRQRKRIYVEKVGEC